MPEIDRLFIQFLHRPDGVWVDRTFRSGDQIFNFVGENRGDDYETMCIYVTELKKLVQLFHAEVERWEIPLTLKNVTEVRKNGGINTSYLPKISGPALNEPGLMLLLPNNEHILCDGNHRFVRRWDLGLRTMRFIAIQEAIWRLALLKIPEKMIRSLAESEG